MSSASKRFDKKFRAGVLGATGMVGQRFVHMLANHPWFELADLAASERSSGRRYADVVNWHLDTPIPEAARNMVVKDLAPNLECDFVFSALDSSVAGTAEEEFARAGYPVLSNSKNHRMDPDVPLLIPEVNASHLDSIPVQQKNRGYESGFIVTNPNCSTAGLVLVRNPIVVVDEENRPQPRHDASAGHGMAAVVGRIRECSLLDVKLALLSHNLVRGAAGAAVLNAELLAVRGFLHHRDAAKLNVAEPVAS